VREKQERIPGPPRRRRSIRGTVCAVALRVAWIYYTWPWPRTVIMSCAVVIADKVAQHSWSLPHTDAQRVICAALRETRRAALRESTVGYLARVKSVQVVAKSHDTLGLRVIPAPIMAATFTRREKSQRLIAAKEFAFSQMSSFDRVRSRRENRLSSANLHADHCFD